MTDILLIFLIILVLVLSKRIKELEEKVDVIVFYQKKIKTINEGIKIMTEVKFKNDKLR